MSNATKPARAKVSVIVPVKNEAANLRRCLPALAWADEVIVVDSQSTDETDRVAAEHGASVVQFHFNGTYPKKKNWALDTIPFRNEWVLIVDADEVVVPELAEEIARRTAGDEAEGFYLNMKYFFLGRRIRHCGYAEAWNLRLFKHKLGRYERMPVDPGAKTGDNEAHEHVELAGKALRLVHELDHHAYPTIAVWVEKHNRYAVWEAAMFERFLREPIPTSIGRGKRFKRLLKKVYLRLPMRPLVRFFFLRPRRGSAPRFSRRRRPRAGLLPSCWHSTTSWPGRMCTSAPAAQAPRESPGKAPGAQPRPAPKGRRGRGSSRALSRDAPPPRRPPGRRGPRRCPAPVQGRPPPLSPGSPPTRSTRAPPPSRKTTTNDRPGAGAPRGGGPPGYARLTQGRGPPHRGRARGTPQAIAVSKGRPTVGVIEVWQ